MGSNTVSCLCPTSARWRPRLETQPRDTFAKPSSNPDVRDDVGLRLLQQPFDQPQRAWLRRYLRGEFIGSTDDLAAPDQEYPIFHWSSRLRKFRRNVDGTFDMTP